VSTKRLRKKLVILGPYWCTLAIEERGGEGEGGGGEGEEKEEGLRRSRSAFKQSVLSYAQKLRRVEVHTP
jgi:hypothetical protein